MNSTEQRNTLAVVVFGLALTAVGCVAPDRSVGTSTGSTAWASSPSVPDTPTAVPPVPADFVIGVIVTEQKCFGSAGCNYRYTINPQYVSANPLPDKTTVVFKVTGGDQDQIGNFTINGDGTATFDRETSISGPEGADLRATVTQVIPDRSVR
ncbi:hypothetical protein [Mycolicibacterium sp. XJ870]